MRRMIFAMMIVLLILSGCEKDIIAIPELERPDTGPSSESRMRDSVYLYTYYFYLWQDKLPPSFQTGQHRNAESVLESLKSYAVDPLGKAYDRFSFLDRYGAVNQEIQQGHLGSFGFDVRYLTQDDLYIKRVHEGSPAYAAGIRRGWKVLEINGRTALDLASMEQDDFAFLFQALDGENIRLRLENPAGGQLSITLSRKLYALNPVLSTEIWEVGGRKIGYFAFDSFLSLSLIKGQLDQAFNYFSSNGVEQLIVDLRYNGGGDVSTATYLTNLIAPVSTHGTLMSYYNINQTLKHEGWDLFLFGPQYFNKQNSLELDKVYFLVTGGTASASELLINNLTPHMDVVLVGDSETYGKPVGYFGWDIMGTDLYAVSFQTLNSLGYGDYFSGMPVDKLVHDDVSRDFGNVDEAMIAQAIFHATNGYFPSTTPLQMSSGNRSLRQRMGPPNTQELNHALDRNEFKAMFDFSKVPGIK